MATQSTMTKRVDELAEFLNRYYHDELAMFAAEYPKDRTAFHVEYGDLYQWDADHAADLVENYDLYQTDLNDALQRLDLPVTQDLSGATVRVTDSKEYLTRLGVGQLDKDHLGDFAALRCQLGKVSERKPRLKVGAFECQRCGLITRVEQGFTEAREPDECDSCERDGPFQLDDGMSEWVDQRKVMLEAPPESDSGAEIVAYCIDDVADPPGVDIQTKAGARVTVLGRLETDYSSLFGPGANEPVADQYFVPEGFVWGDNLRSDVDVGEHRDAVQEWAGREDAIDVFKRNIDPSLVVTDGWDDALEMATVWLFGAPRIDPEDGDTVRGDLHMLFVSDPGMNKSDFAAKLADLSPKALMKDAEGMSSEVALTAAATRGGFGDDSWSIEPGALPKANKGHLVLDEIDKGPDGFLDGIHSPLEGDQTLRVSKAGQEATLATRCGFLALGNPTEGRFDRHENIAAQVDIHPALMSRFDLICTMEDTADEETDTAIAEGVLDSIDESARMEYGDLDATDADAVGGDVPRDVMRAWVKIAREEVHPLLTEAAKDALREFYIEARQLNDRGDDTPTATARKLVAGIRIAMAFARVELSATVEQRHAKRAVSLSKAIIRNAFDPETGQFDVDRLTETPSTQDQRVNAIKAAISDEAKTPSAVAEETGIDASTVERRLRKLSQAGEAIKPSGDEYRLV